MSIDLNPEALLKTAAEIQTANDRINDQNGRLSMFAEIQDEDLQVVSLNGLYEEQQSSIAARDQAASQVNYTALGERSLQDAHDEAGLEADLKKLRTEAEVAHLALEKQVAISLKVSPNSEHIINVLADKKRTAIGQGVRHTEQRLTQLRAQTVGFLALGAAWPIPRVPSGLQEIDDTSIERQEFVSSDQSELILQEQTETPKAPEATVEQEATETQIDGETVLASVMWAVCDYAMKHVGRGVRVEEMRKAVPELMQLSDDEYTFFKGQFPALRDLIQQKLMNSGVAVSWSVSGKTRGTRYHLETKRMSDHTIDTMISKHTELQPGHIAEITTDLANKSSHPAMISKQLISEADVEAVQPLMLNHDLSHEQLLGIPLIKTVMDTISSFQIERDSEVTRRTVLARALSDTLCLEPEDMGYLLSQLEQVGLLHERHVKGMKMLSTVSAPKEITYDNNQREPIKVDTNVNTEEIVNSEKTAESQPELARNLKLLKWGRNDANRGRWMANEVSLRDIASKLGIKDPMLVKEVEQWIQWLCENPTSDAANKIAGAKTATVNHEGQRLSIWRLAPNKSKELLTRVESKYLRVMYTFTDDDLYILEILDHDRYDSKYLNRK